MIINDDSRVINKLETSLNDDARVIIYDCHLFIVQATGWKGLPRARKLSFKISSSVTTKKKFLFGWHRVFPDRSVAPTLMTVVPILNLVEPVKAGTLTTLGL
jgi:hypothetical protein